MKKILAWGIITSPVTAMLTAIIISCHIPWYIVIGSAIVIVLGFFLFFAGWCWAVDQVI